MPPSLTPGREDGGADRLAGSDAGHADARNVKTQDPADGTFGAIGNHLHRSGHRISLTVGRNRDFSQGRQFGLERDRPVFRGLEISSDVHHRFRVDERACFVVEVHGRPDRRCCQIHQHDIGTDGGTIAEMCEVQCDLVSEIDAGAHDQVLLREQVRQGRSEGLDISQLGGSMVFVSFNRRIVEMIFDIAAPRLGRGNEFLDEQGSGELVFQPAEVLVHQGRIGPMPADDALVIRNVDVNGAEPPLLVQKNRRPGRDQ